MVLRGRTKPRLIVLSTDEAAASSIIAWMEASGFQVSLVSSAIEITDIAARASCDLILIFANEKLGETSAICLKIRELGLDRPIMVYFQNETVGDLPSIIATGVVAHFTKTTNLIDIVDTISRVLRS
jgi:DNA-binding response OmpR family regulator